MFFDHRRDMAYRRPSWLYSDCDDCINRFYTALLFKYRLRRSIEEGQKTASQKNAVLIESLYNAESVKLNNAEGVFQKQWENAVGNIADWGVKTRQLSQSSSSFAMVAQQLTTVIIVIVGVYQISEGNMSMGALVAAVMLTGSSARSNGTGRQFSDAL